jgi:hypothetical protein
MNIASNCHLIFLSWFGDQTKTNMALQVWAWHRHTLKHSISKHVARQCFTSLFHGMLMNARWCLCTWFANAKASLTPGCYRSSHNNTHTTLWANIPHLHLYSFIFLVFGARLSFIREPEHLGVILVWAIWRIFLCSCSHIIRNLQMWQCSTLRGRRQVVTALSVPCNPPHSGIRIGVRKLSHEVAGRPVLEGLPIYFMLRARS